MIGLLFAKEQVARLLGLKCFVAAEHKQSAIGEMETAMQTADDIGAAMVFVNDWINEQDEWPTPAQIRRLLFDGRQGRTEAPDNAAIYAANPNHCKRCQNAGFYGGKIGTKYDGEWKWCDCPAGRDRQRIEPDLVVIANQERNELMERIGKVKVKVDRGKVTHVSRTIAALSNEDYHGEF